MVKFERCAENPIIWPGTFEWRMSNTFNPGVIYENGKFYLYERTAGGLRPFHCYIGLLESDDGVHFTQVGTEPVFTPEMAGSKYGSVQDPRVVKIDDAYYMTYAYRPYAWESHPTGVGVPQSYEVSFPGFDGDSERNQTRSGIAISTDRIHWKHHVWATPEGLDDRDVILFPEKINGRFAMFRRPLQFVAPDHSKLESVDAPGMWITFSDDLVTWDEPQMLLRPEQDWEGGRIGGATPPIKTDAGWLVFYHGVQDIYPATRRNVYRMGMVMLDLDDPATVLARTPHFIMEPEAYYERFGLYIPNVIFPTGVVVVNGLIYLYYGCCDTAIGLATAPLDAVIEEVMRYPVVG